MPEPRTFADDEALLADVLTQVVRADAGAGALELHERAVALADRARAGEGGAGEELGALVRDADVGELELLVRSLTRRLQLSNLAEDNERIRALRAGPREGTLRAAVEQLARRGAAAHDVEQGGLRNTG